MKALAVLYTSIPLGKAKSAQLAAFNPPQHCASPVFLFRAMKAEVVLYTSVIPMKFWPVQSPHEYESPQHCAAPVFLFRAMKA